MKCLFCSNLNDNSDEHIVLNSLNGKLHSKQIICSSCNNFFGINLDPIAKKYFNPILLFLEFKNASAIPSENLEGEKNYLIQNDLKIRQVKLNITTHSIENKDLITISGEQRHVSRYFKKEKERREAQGKTLISHNIQELQLDGNQRVEVNFMTPTNLNTLMNKIALQFCHYHKIDLEGVHELMSKTRKLDTETDNVHYCNVDNEIRNFEPYEITRLLIVKSIDQRLYVYVELFNVVCAIVLISTCYSGSEVDFQYYQDAITGEKLLEKVILNEELINEIIDGKSFASKEDFGPQVNRLFRRKADREFKATLEKEVDQIKTELDSAVENELITNDEFNDLWVERTTKMIALVSLEFPYMTDEWDDANNDDINYMHSNLRGEQYDLFCQQYSALVGKTVEFSNGDTFFVEKFAKVPVIEQHGTLVVRVLVVLYNGLERTYVPYRDFFEGIAARDEKVH